MNISSLDVLRLCSWIFLVAPLSPSARGVLDQASPSPGASERQTPSRLTNLADDLASGPSVASKTVPMTSEQIVDRIKQKDWTLVEQPGAIGPAAAAAIQTLLKDQDVEVRELAVEALGQAGGPAARKGLIAALKDRNDMVRAAACRHLQRNYDAADVSELTVELGTNPDEFVREQVGLILGRIGSTNAIAPLSRQLSTESDVHARQAISLALARLGEEANRQAYLKRLRQDDAKERSLAARDFLYVNDRSLLPQLLPLLEDLRPALNVGPSHGPYLIRVCDVTINVLDEFLKHPFSFKIEPARRYTEQEIASARTALAQVK